MGRLPTAPEVRFWKYVNKTKDCWLWTGGVTSNGYGNFRDGNSKQVAAHVFAYQLLVGSILENHYLDHRHTCPKNCVNPEHLRVATNKQNQENRARGANSDNKSTGILGVHRYVDRNRYRVIVRHNGKIYYGGSFPLDELDEAEQAAIALRNRLFTHNDKDRSASA